jgi:hypothetical protein
MRGVNAPLLMQMEIKKIDSRIGELAPFAQPLRIIAELQAVHPRNLSHPFGSTI